MRSATLIVAVLAAMALAGGCGTTHPRPLDRGTLAEAQAFPYFRLYWVGPSFNGHPLVAVDGVRGYNSRIGHSVYYGDCVTGKGVLGGGGSCALPLQVTTVIYRLHSNAALGPQRNELIGGVPATVYDEGRSVELYSGRLAIDVFADTPAHALLAAQSVKPLNVTGAQDGKPPAPVYCPGLWGPVDRHLQRVLDRLRRHPCQRARAALAASARLTHARLAQSG